MCIYIYKIRFPGLKRYFIELCICDLVSSCRNFRNSLCIFVDRFWEYHVRHHDPRDSVEVSVLTWWALKLLVWPLEFSNPCVCLSFTECSYYMARARKCKRAASGGRIAFEEGRCIVRFNRVPLQSALSRAWETKVNWITTR